MGAIPYNETHPSQLEAWEAEAFDTAMMLSVEGRIWAVREELVLAMADRSTFTISSEVASRLMEAHQAARQSRSSLAPDKGVAVVPLKGVLMPMTGLMSLFMGGGGGLPQFRSELLEAARNPDVKAIVMDVDSPGGLVDHIPETAELIRSVRDTKPVVAVANPLSASAAYWLASQAHEVAVTPSGEAGSIGVYQIHQDLSGAAEQRGIKHTVISAGKFKTEGNPYEPLGDEAAASAQQSVNDYYQLFVKGVADGRGILPQDVADGYGEGRVLTAKRAVQAGLADRVATLGQTVARVQSGRAKIRQTDDAEPKSSDRLEISEPQARPLTREEKDRMLETLAGAR